MMGLFKKKTTSLNYNDMDRQQKTININLVKELIGLSENEEFKNKLQELLVTMESLTTYRTQGAFRTDERITDKLNEIKLSLINNPQQSDTANEYFRQINGLLSERENYK